MEGPRSYKALGGLDTYEQMVNSFAKSAEDYWRMWGPLGEPMVRSVEGWAEMQRTYLKWLRQAYGGGN